MFAHRLARAYMQNTESGHAACADAFTPHSSRLSSELRPLASVPLLQHAPAPAVTMAAHVDRLTSASMRWLQVHACLCSMLISPTFWDSP